MIRLALLIYGYNGSCHIWSKLQSEAEILHEFLAPQLVGYKWYDDVVCNHTFLGLECNKTQKTCKDHQPATRKMRR
jgi:hypothetical protein